MKIKEHKIYPYLKKTSERNHIHSDNEDSENSYMNTFSFKKNLKEIIYFNNFILEKYQKFIQKKSKLILDLKNLNEELTRNNKAIKELNIKQLNLIYLKMSGIYLFFLSEFLKFSCIDEETIDNIISNFNSNHDIKKKQKKNKKTKNYLNKNSEFEKIKENTDDDYYITFNKDNLPIHNLNTKITNKAYKKQASASFFSEMEENISYCNDNGKIVNFINNILLQRDYIYVEIKEVNYSQNKFEICVDLNLTVEKLNFYLITGNYEDESESNINNTYLEGNGKGLVNMKKASVFVTFTFKKLFTYLNNYSSNFSRFGIVKSLLGLMNDVNEYVYLHGKKSFESELTSLLNEFLNDLFHLRSEIFYLFNLNKIFVNFFYKFSFYFYLFF